MQKPPPVWLGASSRPPEIRAAGPMVFAGASILVATDPDNTRVAAWNTTTGELITELEPLDLAVNELAAGVLPNGRTIAVAAGANGIGRWDVHTGKALASLSDDAYWSVATNGKAIDRWDLSTGESIGRPTLFTTASEEMLLRRWDALTGEPIGDRNRPRLREQAVGENPGAFEEVGQPRPPDRHTGIGGSGTVPA